MNFRHKPYFAPAIVLVAAVGGWFFGSRENTDTAISFLAVGQGDCTVLSSKGYTVLIDDGPLTQYEDAAGHIILPWLSEHSYHHVDAVFLSHPDEDHVGGTREIVDKFPGAKIIVSDQFRNDAEMTKRLAEWKMSPEVITWIPKYSQLNIGEVHVSIECPDKAPGSDANDGSMFMRISAGQGSAVLSGDAPKEVEKVVERDENWKAEIVHVGHHGSHTATDPSWLETLKPTYAVISVGRNNRYHHPTQEVLDRLAAYHVKTFRTDRDGTITFRFDGTTFVKSD